MDDGAGGDTVRYAHPGYDLIARESMELRQREDELRGRWREMGFQLPQVYTASDCQCFERRTHTGNRIGLAPIGYSRSASLGLYTCTYKINERQTLTKSY